MHRHIMEALDRSLRDLTGISAPFGGKILLLGGDFRQILPVIRHASRVQIVDASLKKSPLWKEFRQLYVFYFFLALHLKFYFVSQQIKYFSALSQNLRIGNNQMLALFDNYLHDLGDGQIPVEEEPDWIALPARNVFNIDDTNQRTLEHSLEQFCDKIFPELARKFSCSEAEWIKFLGERAILAPRHVDVNMINAKVLEWLPGELTEAISVDFTVNVEDQLQFPVEFLNTQQPTGLPPAVLHLKVISRNFFVNISCLSAFI